MQAELASAYGRSTSPRIAARLDVAPIGDINVVPRSDRNAPMKAPNVSHHRAILLMD